MHNTLFSTYMLLVLLKFLTVVAGIWIVVASQWVPVLIPTIFTYIALEALSYKVIQLDFNLQR